MADTLAVTNAGVLQQYDSPECVFTHPMNTFVAGVVDSRAMSLMNVKIVVPLTAPALLGVANGGGNCRRLRRGHCQPLGIPSSLMHGNHDPATYTGYTGSDTQPHFYGGGGDITYVHLFLVSSIIVASLRPDVRLHSNGTVWIKFDQDRCHLFDGG